MSLLGRLRSAVDAAIDEFQNNPSEPAVDDIQYESAEERVEGSDLSVEKCIGWSDRADKLQEAGEGTACPEDGCDRELTTIEHNVEQSAENFQSRTGGASQTIEISKETGSARGRAEGPTKQYVHCPNGECRNHFVDWKAERAHKGDNLKQERALGGPDDQDPYAGTTMDGIESERSLSETPSAQPDPEKVLETEAVASAGGGGPEAGTNDSAPDDADDPDHSFDADDGPQTSDDDNPSPDVADAPDGSASSDSDTNADNTAESPDDNSESVEDLGGLDDDSPDSETSPEPNSPSTGDGGMGPSN